MAPTPPPAEAEAKTPASSDGPTTAQLLGGVALIGAAAGYAALAARFRNFSAASRGAGAAEMRAGEAFAGEWARREAAPNFTKAEFDEAFRKWRSGGKEPGGVFGRGGGGAPDWALQELGLTRADGRSLERAKAAYRSRARESHPDSGGDSKTFQRVSQAWAVVKEHAE